MVTPVKPGARLKTANFNVKASPEQVARWRAAARPKYRSVSAWLEDLAEREAKRVAELGRPAGER